MNIIITGTSRGIGLELSSQALKKRHTVLAVARAPGDSPGLQALKREFGSRLELLACDVTDGQAPQKIEQAVKGWPCVDVLINNAGIYEDGETAEEMARSFATNATAPLFVTRALYPSLKKSKQPKVLHITSLTWLIAAVMHPGWVQTRMGGQGAPTSAAESAQGIWKVIEGLKPKDSGQFFDFEGDRLPW